jgi:hypothetical protein
VIAQCAAIWAIDLDAQVADKRAALARMAHCKNGPLQKWPAAKMVGRANGLGQRVKNSGSSRKENFVPYRRDK